MLFDKRFGCLEEEINREAQTFIKAVGDFLANAVEVGFLPTWFYKIYVTQKFKNFVDNFDTMYYYAELFIERRIKELAEKSCKPSEETEPASSSSSWPVQHDTMGSLHVGQKSRETEDSSTGSALSGWKFHLCNAGNARSNAIPEGLVTRDPPPISCSLLYPTKTERRHIILSKFFCILINSLLGNVFDSVF